MRYVGRFAPSPTGPLHAGSLVAALASWLDARAARGQWLVRIEDVDTPRCAPGAAATILQQLAGCGIMSDATPVYQSQRGALYAAALRRLVDAGLAYSCGCTRREIDDAIDAAATPRERHAERIYPGTCRDGLHGKPARAMRLRTQQPDGADSVIDWTDRRLGPQRQNVTRDVGDFVLRRSDGLWAYQLAVVVDDADQGVTHVVRGEDLADNTPRQIHLQRCLGLPTPAWLHTPLVLHSDGEKLSKGLGAEAVEPGRDVVAAAFGVLGLRADPTAALGDLLASAVTQWGARWPVA